MLEPSCRLYVLLAPKAPVGVILRRGPSRHVRLIRWRLDDDRFEPGQWFKGRVYERRCVLSPSGDLLITFAARQRPPLYSWTALSRPPWFTALALWPKGDCWTGGGLFESDRRLRLDHGFCQTGLADGFRLPAWFAVEPLVVAGGSRGGDERVESARLVRDGWQLIQPDVLRAEQDRASRRWRFRYDRLWQKAQPGGRGRALRMLLDGIGEPGGPWYRLDHEVVDRAGELRVYLPETDWADWDRNGDLLFSRGGGLFRLPAAHVAQGDDFGESARRLADFTDMRFARIEAPAAATRW